MNTARKKSLFAYGIIFISVVLIDRMTKNWALSDLLGMKKFLPGVYADLLFNRGVSWGFFQASSHTLLVVQSIVISSVLFGLLVYTMKRLRLGYTCLGEVLVLAGGFSNMIDRVRYGAVVDFILVRFGFWDFPTFNIADVAVVLGVGIMLLREIYDSRLD